MKNKILTAISQQSNKKTPGIQTSYGNKYQVAEIIPGMGASNID